jgi:pyrroline-5-carboxylate reductase
VSDTRIGFIGAGNMASALISGLLGSGLALAKDVRASDPQRPLLARLESAHGIVTTASNADVARWANVIVLAVKPQIVPAVLSECGSQLGAGHLVLSIAAGVSTQSIEERVGEGTRVIRAMPNTPALARAAATAIAPGASATSDDIEWSKRFFDAIGRTVVLDEAHLDAVTGLSGSGPAYVMLFIEALADGGVRAGLPRDVALLLATQTVLGSAKLLLETGEHPARLKDMVTSPGGTTIAGLAALESGGFRGALIEAVTQAARRSTELGKNRK